MLHLAAWDACRSSQRSWGEAQCTIFYAQLALEGRWGEAQCTAFYAQLALASSILQFCARIMMPACMLPPFAREVPAMGRCSQYAGQPRLRPASILMPA